MELFEKIYSCYYQVVGQILRESERHPVTVKEMEGIIRKYGFQESVLTILPNLTGGEWAFMKKGRDGTYTPAVSHLPKLPLTGLQQRWLKSIIADRRISLFLSDSDLAWAGELLKDTEPLFDEEDFYYFDRFKDGDDYNSKQYGKISEAFFRRLKRNRRYLSPMKEKRVIRLRMRRCPISFSILQKTTSSGFAAWNTAGGISDGN